MLRREVADPIVSEKFYRVVVQAVLLLGAETWVLTATVLQKLEGVNVGFLRQVAGMTARKMGVDTWQKEGAERVVQAIGTNPMQEYIEKKKETVTEWLALRPVSKVCAKETGFGGRGRARGQCWRQTAAERQLKTTLKEILVAARKWRRWESGRHGEVGGESEEADFGGDR